MSRPRRAHRWTGTRSGRVLAVVAALVLAWATPVLVPAAAEAADRPTGFAALPAGGGYWVVYADGDVRAFGAAAGRGSMLGHPLNGPVVGIASTATGKGYWLVGSDGGIFSFGDAAFYGSMGATKLNQPVIGMAATTSGHGYWMFASDGGIFSFGDAPFYGSTGAITLNQPITGMTARPTDHGYWMVAKDGGIFAFGDAPFTGSTGGQALPGPVVGMLRTPSGKGYWVVGRDGSVYNFGDGGAFGSTAGLSPAPTIIGLAARSGGADGYILVSSTGQAYEFGPSAPPVGDFKVATEYPAGHAVRWSPCTAIRYRINPGAYGLAAAKADVEAAIAASTASSRLTFSYLGTTADAPHPPPQNNQTKAGLGIVESDTDFVVAFSNATETPGLADSVAGLGGFVGVVSTDGKGMITAGFATVDYQGYYAGAADGWANGASKRSLLAHELGHAMGLSHPDSTHELMTANLQSTNSGGYQNGDKAGLTLMGQRSCPGASSSASSASGSASASSSGQDRPAVAFSSAATDHTD